MVAVDCLGPVWPLTSAICRQRWRLPAAATNDGWRLRPQLWALAALAALSCCDDLPANIDNEFCILYFVFCTTISRDYKMHSVYGMYLDLNPFPSLLIMMK